MWKILDNIVFSRFEDVKTRKECKIHGYIFVVRMRAARSQVMFSSEVQVSLVLLDHNIMSQSSSFIIQDIRRFINKVFLLLLYNFSKKTFVYFV